jgi:hypothetical protein
MNPTDTDSEFAILTTAAGRALLEDVSAVVDPSPAQITRWRKNSSALEVAAALRIAAGRRRGRAKFSDAERLWLDSVGVEQATAEPVARQKAMRFAGCNVVDLCSGVGGDAIAIAREGGRVVAVDLDHGMARRLRWNAEIAGVGDRLLAVQGRAESFPIPADSLLHIDPDRRFHNDRRARSVVDYAPGLETLNRLCRHPTGGAIKLGPASDFDDHFDAPGHEIELISLGGECREATVWFGPLASCRRRATRLPDGATWTDLDGPETADVPRRPPARFVATTDPALSRSGLVSGFAVAHGLSQVAEQGNLLTADERVDHAFLSWFEVMEMLPFDRRTLRSLVATLGLGPLEIKVLGVRVTPETLRSELRPPGPNPATLLLYPDGSNIRVIVCRRVPVTLGRAS